MLIPHSIAYPGNQLQGVISLFKIDERASFSSIVFLEDFAVLILVLTLLALVNLFVPDTNRQHKTLYFSSTKPERSRSSTLVHSIISEL